VVQFEFFRLFEPFTERRLEGRKRVLRFHQRASSLERPCVYLPKQKVPRPYSGAEDGAPSLTGSRDDDLFDKDGHDFFNAVQTVPLLKFSEAETLEFALRSHILHGCRII
jgi:hypothetical protein